uniref:ATP synthase subunit a n=1 Tax=Hackeriella veitchi TaxID=60873 RepID=L7N6J5_9HEMI|nr:ATP synthase F0 subunit 6 [Hackeriella veitchi]ACV96704.1 ATP synthase F0 subunit 6 [Hackeriella veitchi]
MMSSLFSSFDPTTIFNSQLNWMVIMITLVLIPLNYWIILSPLHTLWNTLQLLIHQELKKLLAYKYMGSTLMMVTLFMIILLNNLMGLFPYVFTSTSHATLPMIMSFPLWLSFMLFGWLKTTNKKFTHLVPEGTPSYLMPFTVLVETLSNIIRPGAITLRLMTNMTAGHFLITLLGNNFPTLDKLFLPVMVLMQSMLIMFETMVSYIQAYVFTILIGLYFEE